MAEILSKKYRSLYVPVCPFCNKEFHESDGEPVDAFLREDVFETFICPHCEKIMHICWSRVDCFVTETPNLEIEERKSATV